MKHHLLEDCAVVLRQPVIWGDMDAFDHVNNTVYFRYFEDVRMAFFDRVGVIQHKEGTQVGPILASTSCDFRLPLKYPDVVCLGGNATVLSEKKIKMDYRVVSETLDAVVAEGQGLLVYYDYSENRSCPIPEQILNRIAQLDT